MSAGGGGVRARVTAGRPHGQAVEVVVPATRCCEQAVVRLDHAGFASVHDMFRTVTAGWAQMLLWLKAYVETGARAPFFDF